MPACIIAVASMFSWIAGCRPASASAWKREGMTMTKVWRPLSRLGSISAKEISSGGWNCGGSSASRMRAESCERSSSTIAIEALCSSCEMPEPAPYTPKENAHRIRTSSTGSARRL